MHIITIRRAVVALALTTVVGTSAAVVATAGDGARPTKDRICHPVEGKGEYGQGWNVIDVSHKAAHFRDGKPKHTTKDGRSDFIAKAGQFCHEGSTPSSSTTSTTTSSSSTSSSTSPSSSSTSTTSSTSGTTSTSTTVTSPPSSSTTTAPSTSTTQAGSPTSSGPSPTKATRSSTASSPRSTGASTAPSSTSSADRSVAGSSGPTELARTGTNGLGDGVIVALFLLMVGVLIYVFRGRGGRH